MGFIGLLLFVAYFVYNLIEVNRDMKLGLGTKQMFIDFFFALPIDIIDWIKSR